LLTLLPLCKTTV